MLGYSISKGGTPPLKLKSTILIADFQKFYTICFLYIERIKNKNTNFSLRVGRFLAKYVIEKCLSAEPHFYMIGTWQKLENFTQSYSLLVLCLVEAQFFLNASKKNILPKTSIFLFWSHFFGDIDVPYFAHTQKLKKRANSKHK